LAAHLKKFHGTLVRRGTPVEKHCTKQSRLIQILFVILQYFVLQRIASRYLVSNRNISKTF
jgi:hypothetical protein